MCVCSERVREVLSQHFVLSPSLEDRVNEKENSFAAAAVAAPS